MNKIYKNIKKLMVISLFFACFMQNLGAMQRGRGVAAMRGVPGVSSPAVRKPTAIPGSSSGQGFIATKLPCVSQRDSDCGLHALLNALIMTQNVDLQAIRRNLSDESLIRPIVAEWKSKLPVKERTLINSNSINSLLAHEKTKGRFDTSKIVTIENPEQIKIFENENSDLSSLVSVDNLYLCIKTFNEKRESFAIVINSPGHWTAYAVRYEDGLPKIYFADSINGNANQNIAQAIFNLVTSSKDIESPEVLAQKARLERFMSENRLEAIVVFYRDNIKIIEQAVNPDNKNYFIGVVKFLEDNYKDNYEKLSTYVREWYEKNKPIVLDAGIATSTAAPVQVATEPKVPSTGASTSSASRSTPPATSTASSQVPVMVPERPDSFSPQEQQAVELFKQLEDILSQAEAIEKINSIEENEMLGDLLKKYSEVYIILYDLGKDKSDNFWEKIWSEFRPKYQRFQKIEKIYNENKGLFEQKAREEQEKLERQAQEAQRQEELKRQQEADEAASLALVQELQQQEETAAKRAREEQEKRDAEFARSLAAEGQGAKVPRAVSRSVLEKKSFPGAKPVARIAPAGTPQSLAAQAASARLQRAAGKR